MPFQQSCKIVLVNKGHEAPPVWSMVDWHSYDNDVEITPYRFHAEYNKTVPVEDLGSFRMGSISGKGFIAGMTMAIVRHDYKDVIYHTGGDTWLIDGETNPHVLRGIGVEDVFTQSFGFNFDNSQWAGVPYNDKNSALCGEGVAYRFFFIDAVAFKSSIIMRMGTRYNQTESVVYYFKSALNYETPHVLTPYKWALYGPFNCETKTDFDQKEFPENETIVAPDSLHWAKGRRNIAQPTWLESENTWIDFARSFRRNFGGNVGTQPVKSSAYALAEIKSDKDKNAIINLGFDDWIKVWVNDELVLTSTHDKGFAVRQIPVTLKKGKNKILIKLSNFDNIEWRCWAFSCRILNQEL